MSPIPAKYSATVNGVVADMGEVITQQRRAMQAQGQGKGRLFDSITLQRFLAENGCLSAAVAHFGERGGCAGLAEEGGDLPALNVVGVAPSLEDDGFIPAVGFGHGFFAVPTTNE